MAVARTHATKATEALAGATELDADVCGRLRTLVDGLVLRSFVSVTLTRRRRARDVFARRVDAWLAADLDAYMECWARRHGIEMPSGVIDGAAKYRKLVDGELRVGRAGVVRRAPPRVRCRRRRSCSPTGRSALAAARTTSWSSGAGCRCASCATARSAGGASITSRRPRRSRRARSAADYAERRLGASTSSRNRSTASLNAFGASAIRPCAAPRNT